jgi:hypothetical protein
MIRLCYPRGSDNVGDEMNAWLWPALLGDIRNDADIELLGIGTPLNEPFCRHLHAELSIALRGTGTGAPPQLDGRGGLQ